MRVVSRGPQTVDVAYYCEACGERVKPKSEIGIVYAVERRLVPVPGKGAEYQDGLPCFFHAMCYPEGSPRYKRKPMPVEIDDGVAPHRRWP